jgi:molybdopterin synthase sulfur carrier subunit
MAFSNRLPVCHRFVSHVDHMHMAFIVQVCKFAHGCILPEKEHKVSISVCFFASLRERLGRDREELDYQPGLTAADVWSRVAGGVELPNALVAINHTHASMQDTVEDGDEIAFFPPVTGG